MKIRMTKLFCVCLLAASMHGINAVAGPETTEVIKTTVGAIVAQPTQFDKKTVCFEGRLVEMCKEDGCLVIKDKVDLIEAVPPTDMELPKLKPGMQLRVTGTVHAKGSGTEAKVDLRSVEEVKK